MAASGGSPWSREEVEATVADYLRMLRLHLTGQPYNKAAHNRALVRQLGRRTRGAVELKHQNISAVLEEQGKQFVLARVHEFRSAPKFFELKGSIRKNVLLDAVSFIARL